MVAVTYEQAIEEARGLCSENYKYTEYDRALCELIARMFPDTGDTQIDGDGVWQDITNGGIRI